jgi:hypothetical protein
MDTGDKRRTASAVAVAVLLLAGCGRTEELGQDTPELQFDQAVDRAIDGVATNGTSVLVRDLISVEWDEVALFSEGATETKIEDVVGDSGLNGRYVSSTNLLVFRATGEVVALIGTSPDVFTGEYGVLFGPEAIFTSDQARDGYVRLADGS